MSTNIRKDLKSLSMLEAQDEETLEARENDLDDFEPSSLPPPELNLRNASFDDLWNELTIPVGRKITEEERLTESRLRRRAKLKNQMRRSSFSGFAARAKLARDDFATLLEKGKGGRKHSKPVSDDGIVNQSSLPSLQQRKRTTRRARKLSVAFAEGAAQSSTALKRIGSFVGTVRGKFSSFTKLKEEKVESYEEVNDDETFMSFSPQSSFTLADEKNNEEKSKESKILSRDI